MLSAESGFMARVHIEMKALSGIFLLHLVVFGDLACDPLPVPGPAITD
jgi:hypothetical protein